MSRLLEGGGPPCGYGDRGRRTGAGAAAARTPLADYQFHNNRSSSVPGAPDLADLGSGNAFATESVNGCATRVLTFPQGNGLLADTSSLIPGSSTGISEAVVIDLRLADVSGYRRLIQSSDSTSDTGLYVHDGLVDWYEGGPHQTGLSPVISNNSFVEVALYQGQITNQFTKVGFVNGVEQSTDTSLSFIGGHPRLFKDNDPPGTTGEDSAGAVYRVRFYGGGLVTGDFATIYSQSLLATPSSCPAASASPTGKPRATKGPHGAIVVDTGVNASCPDTGVDCTGTGSVAGGGAKKSKVSTLGTSSFTAPAGQSQAVTVTLS